MLVIACVCRTHRSTPGDSPMALGLTDVHSLEPGSAAGATTPIPLTVGCEGSLKVRCRCSKSRSALAADSAAAARECRSSACLELLGSTVFSAPTVFSTGVRDRQGFVVAQARCSDRGRGALAERGAPHAGDRPAGGIESGQQRWRPPTGPPRSCGGNAAAGVCAGRALACQRGVASDLLLRRSSGGRSAERLPQTVVAIREPGPANPVSEHAEAFGGVHLPRERSRMQDLRSQSLVISFHIALFRLLTGSRRINVLLRK